MQLLFWIAALVVGAAPRRHWDRLDPPFPLVRSAIAAGIVTFVAGCAIGIRGFFHFAGALAGANNDWMLARLSAPPAAGDAAVGMVPYSVSILTFFLYLLTP